MKKALSVTFDAFASVFVGILSAIMWALIFISHVVEWIAGLFGVLVVMIDSDAGESIMQKIIEANEELGFKYVGDDE